MYTESNNDADNNKLPPWKRILYIAVFLLLVFASILIYFYFNSFNKKVSIKQEGYIFWEDADIEPKICDFKIEGRFERYLFSNKRNTLVGKIYINDELVVNSAWTNIEGTLSKWQRYDFDPDREYMEPWQLDLLNNPNKILNRLKGEIK